MSLNVVYQEDSTSDGVINLGTLIISHQKWHSQPLTNCWCKSWRLEEEVEEFLMLKLCHAGSEVPRDTSLKECLLWVAIRSLVGEPIAELLEANFSNTTFERVLLENPPNFPNLTSGPHS